MNVHVHTSVHLEYNTQCSSNFHLKLEGRIISQIIIGGRGGGAGEKFANKTGNFRGDSMALFKCRPIRHWMM